MKLMSPEYVRAYVKAHKNDDRDAEGIAEAASRPTMRFVDLKSQEQLDIQTLHRVRSRLVDARRTLLNQLRAILFERGRIVAAGRRKLELAVEAMLTEENSSLERRMRQLVGGIRAEWLALDKRIEALNGEFVALAKADEATRKLVTIPGVGVLSASALVAAIATARRSGGGGISAPGSVWCPGRTAPAARRSCLGPRLVQSQKAMAVVRATPERKLAASLS